VGADLRRRTAARIVVSHVSEIAATGARDRDARGPERQDTGMTASRLEPCPGCKTLVPAVDGPGPTHEYMRASPGCWALFGEVTARQYADVRYRAGGLQMVDAYAVQHPGVPERRASQSVRIHLVSLCLRLEPGPPTTSPSGSSIASLPRTASTPGSSRRRRSVP